MADSEPSLTVIGAGLPRTGYLISHDSVGDDFTWGMSPRNENVAERENDTILWCLPTLHNMKRETN